MRTSVNAFLATATFATMALARTDLEGCTRTDVSSPAGASYAWYVPGTGEVCEILDCGGGRAPPKTTVPGCAAYSGTETYSPSYLAGFQASATAAPSTSALDAQTTASDADESDSTSSSFNWSALETDTAESSWDLYTTLGSATGPITAIPTSTEAEATSSIAAITSAASSVVAPESSTLVAQTTAAGNAPNNGTVSTGRPGTNGTLSNGTATPSAPVSDSGVAGPAQAWVGGAGTMMGLAGLVAFL